MVRDKMLGVYGSTKNNHSEAHTRLRKRHSPYLQIPTIERNLLPVLLVTCFKTMDVTLLSI
jgi:hypothetical protein